MHNGCDTPKLDHAYLQPIISTQHNVIFFNKWKMENEKMHSNKHVLTAFTNK